MGVRRWRDAVDEFAEFAGPVGLVEGAADFAGAGEAALGEDGGEALCRGVVALEAGEGVADVGGRGLPAGGAQELVLLEAQGVLELAEGFLGGVGAATFDEPEVALGAADHVGDALEGVPELEAAGHDEGAWATFSGGLWGGIWACL